MVDKPSSLKVLISKTIHPVLDLSTGKGRVPLISRLVTPINPRACEAGSKILRREHAGLIGFSFFSHLTV